MFFLKDIERSITLHPSFFSRDIHARLSNQLLHDVEGTYQEDYFIVCVMENHEFTEGKVVPGSAVAEYRVHYRAIVWKPFKGEVVDGLVSQVVETGFFVEIGPMTAFVAKGMIPAEITFNSLATPPQWTDNGQQVIEKGKPVRIKIKGIRSDMGNIYAIGTINEDYLGSFEDGNGV